MSIIKGVYRCSVSAQTHTMANNVPPLDNLVILFRSLDLIAIHAAHMYMLGQLSGTEITTFDPPTQQRQQVVSIKTITNGLSES